MKSLTVFNVSLALFFIVLSVTACAPKRIDPLATRILPSDMAETPYPPTQEELTRQPDVLLPLIVFKDLTVNENRQKKILGLIHSALSTYGNFSVISQDQVARILENEKYRKTLISNVADALRIGIENNADYVSQIQIRIIESKTINTADTFKANVNLTMFKTDTGQVVFKTDIQYDSANPDQVRKDVKNLTQTYFKLMGYILETRGGKEVVKITLGKSMGIELKREFEIRQRVVTSEFIGGLARTKITYKPDVIATGQVVKVSENSSWLLIKKGDREKIKKGQVVFALPEKSGMFGFINK